MSAEQSTVSATQTEVPFGSIAVLSANLQKDTASLWFVWRLTDWLVTFDTPSLARAEEYKTLYHSEEKFPKWLAAIQKLLLEGIWPQIEAARPETTSTVVTLQTFLSAPHFRLHHPGGNVEATGMKSMYNLEPQPLGSLIGHERWKHIRASEISIPEPTREKFHLPDYIVWEGQTVRLELCVNYKSETKREFEILDQLHQTGLSEKYRVDSLVGLIVSDDEQQVVGLLLRGIPDRVFLSEVSIEDRRKWRGKWYNEVAEILTAMHAVGVACGGLSASSVWISREEAWMVGFGGMSNGDVEDMVREGDTKAIMERDWRDLERILGERWEEFGRFGVEPDQLSKDSARDLAREQD